MPRCKCAALLNRRESGARKPVVKGLTTARMTENARDLEILGFFCYRELACSCQHGQLQNKSGEQ
jgi:hypothetical protein